MRWYWQPGWHHFAIQRVIPQDICWIIDCGVFRFACHKMDRETIPVVGERVSVLVSERAYAGYRIVIGEREISDYRAFTIEP